MGLSIVIAVLNWVIIDILCSTVLDNDLCMCHVPRFIMRCNEQNIDIRERESLFFLCKNQRSMG